MRPLVEKRNEIGHEVEFPPAPCTPAQAEGLHQVGEVFAVEDHAVENGVDKGRERLGRQPVSQGEVLNLLGLLRGFELLVARADLLLV